MSGTRYIAVVGCDNYFGFKIFKPGMPIKLEKESDNDFDMEAIKAVIDPIGKVGYVANSVHTVPKGCHSAGRIYDTFDKYTLGMVRFVTHDVVILELMKQTKFSYQIKITVFKLCRKGLEQSQYRILRKQIHDKL
jgi:hypothetical protein